MIETEKWMKYAYLEAVKAYDRDEVPVGCVIIFQDSIIAKAYNQVESLKDPTAHCEILAITSAASYLNSKQLTGCSMYVTLEPCSMCAGALILAKIDNLFIGTPDPKSGACGSVINIANNKSLNHKIKIYSGILEKECSEILKEFFKEKRKSSKSL